MKILIQSCEQHVRARKDQYLPNQPFNQAGYTANTSRGRVGRGRNIVFYFPTRTHEPTDRRTKPPIESLVRDKRCQEDNRNCKLQRKDLGVCIFPSREKKLREESQRSNVPIGNGWLTRGKKGRLI